MHPSNKIVHGLWIGPQLSALELLTIHSFLNHGHAFHLWTYEPPDNDLPADLILEDANEILHHKHIFRYKNKNTVGHGKGSLAGYSDIFRYKLLYEKGGWWSDMDITCLKPLDFEAPYVFRNHTLLDVVGNLMKCPQGSPLMKSCFEIALENVNEDNTDWLKPVAILNDQIKHYQLSNYIQKDISNPDRWDIVDQYRLFPKRIPKRYYVMHWMNEEWRSKGVDKNTTILYSTLDIQMEKFGVSTQKITLDWPLLTRWKTRIKNWIIPLIPFKVRQWLKKLGVGKVLLWLQMKWRQYIQSNLWQLRPTEIWNKIKVVLFPLIPKAVLRVYRRFKYGRK